MASNETGATITRGESSSVLSTPPPGLKESSDVLRLVELDKVELGAVIRLTLEPKGTRCQGTVYTIDPVTQTLVIFNRVVRNLNIIFLI